MTWEENQATDLTSCRLLRNLHRTISFPWFLARPHHLPSQNQPGAFRGPSCARRVVWEHMAPKELWNFFFRICSTKIHRSWHSWKSAPISLTNVARSMQIYQQIPWVPVTSQSNSQGKDSGIATCCLFLGCCHHEYCNLMIIWLIAHITPLYLQYYIIIIN